MYSMEHERSHSGHLCVGNLRATEILLHIPTMVSFVSCTICTYVCGYLHRSLCIYTHTLVIEHKMDRTTELITKRKPQINDLYATVIMSIARAFLPTYISKVQVKKRTFSVYMLLARLTFNPNYIFIYTNYNLNTCAT